MHLLLISNSTNYGEEYLSWPKDHIKNYLKEFQVREVLFVPYAGVGLDETSIEASYNNYEKKVIDVFAEFGVEIKSVHHFDDPVQAVNEAESIAVGGGNTFHLVGKMQETGIMKAIADKVKEGTSYMGWSAGSNVACPTLMTTNDMPIYQPQSFDCMDLIPFQINPHYLDVNPEGHGGETRQQRLDEFMVVNRDMPVVGLREGTLLEIHGDLIQLVGSRPLVYMKFGEEPRDFEPGSDISFLIT